MTAAPVVIDARQVTRTYQDSGGNEVHALRGMDLAVRQGELVAVMGASGSGKSTLLQIIGGLDSATSGSVHVGGASLTTMNEGERTAFRKTHVGFVFQAFHLVPSMTVVENVALSAVVTNEKPARWRTRALEVLILLGLVDLAERYPQELSGGERQRVAVGRAMFGEPDVILADEPTGNLDSVSSESVLELLRSAITESSRACGILVTHDFHAASFANRVVAARDGRVIDELALSQDVSAETTPRGGTRDVERIRSWAATAPA